MANEADDEKDNSDVVDADIVPFAVEDLIEVAVVELEELGDEEIVCCGVRDTVNAAVKEIDTVGEVVMDRVNVTVLVMGAVADTEAVLCAEREAELSPDDDGLADTETVSDDDKLADAHAVGAGELDGADADGDTEFRAVALTEPVSLRDALAAPLTDVSEVRDGVEESTVDKVGEREADPVADAGAVAEPEPEATADVDGPALALEHTDEPALTEGKDDALDEPVAADDADVVPDAHALHVASDADGDSELRADVLCAFE